MSHLIVTSVVQGNNFQTAQNVVDFLQDAFPGWGWTASCDDGILYIKNSDLSETWGMQLRINDIDKRQIIMAGGQLLDRFNMPSKFNKRTLDESKVDFTGMPESEKWTQDRRYYIKNEKRWKA